MKNLIDVKSVVIGEESVQAVSARELYLDLGMNPAKWARWQKRMIENNEWFIEGRDWVILATCGKYSTAGQPSKDFAINLRFAQHIAMMAKTLKGHDYRNYLIDCEKQLVKLSQADENTNCLKAITRNNNEVRENYKALIEAGLLEAHAKSIFKRVYLPTAKGLQYVKTSNHDIARFKPKYHDLIIEAVGEYREKLSCDNADLFLESLANPTRDGYFTCDSVDLFFEG
jgi:anti-repressor protein